MRERLTIFESRQYFSMPVSRSMKPTPPVHSIASPEARCATTLAQYFVMAACLVKLRPFFLSPCVRSRTLSRLIAVRNLERHALEGTHWLSELLALVCIRNCLVECALGEANHLGCDADAT
jgi:hypothetical protein